MAANIAPKGLSPQDDMIRKLWAGLGPRSPSGNAEWSLREIGEKLDIPHTTVSYICKKNGWVRQETIIKALTKKQQAKLASKVTTKFLDIMYTKDWDKANLIELSAGLKAVAEFERKAEEALGKADIDTLTILTQLDEALAISDDYKSPIIVDAQFTDITPENTRPEVPTGPEVGAEVTEWDPEPPET